MSIATEITRITNLRNTIRTKLVNLGIITNSSATLSDCSTAINGLSKVTPSTPATTITVSPTMSIASSTGIVTASGSNTASVKPSSSKGYTDGSSTAGTITAKVSKTLQLTTQAAQTITPGTSNKTIAAGRWLTGAQTIKGDSNLVAANIKSGKSIFGVSGTLSEAMVKETTLTNVAITNKTITISIADIIPYYIFVMGTNSNSYFSVSAFRNSDGSLVMWGAGDYSTVSVSGTTITIPFSAGGIGSISSLDVFMVGSPR